MDNEMPSPEGLPPDLRLSALFFVLPDGFGSRARKIAARYGAGGGTMFYGSGTASSKVLKFLGLADSRKEILLMLVNADAVDSILETSSHELELDQPGTGIAFAIPALGYAGKRGTVQWVSAEKEECKNMNGQCAFNLIFTIVERGFSDDVVEASREAGASGGTIITGRGTGIHETETFFGITIEPEKEIVLTLVPEDKTAAVMEQINQKLHLNKPGKGVSFSMPVSHTSGICHTGGDGKVH